MKTALDREFMHDDTARADVRARAFEEMTDGVLIADDARRLVDVNDALQRLSDADREVLLLTSVDGNPTFTPDPPT